MKWLLLSLAALIAGCHASPQPTGQATIIWISLDGFRHDYLERIKPPTLSRLAREGAFTNQERPIFPSLTFPNHIAQVTGTTVDGHGIPSNNFYDRTDQKTYDFPDDGSAIRAEPIWITAKRAGLRVAVIDWPMSHHQAGPLASDYRETRYDSTQTDRQRLEHVADILRNDHGTAPLRLVMTYMANVDKIGHQFGPDSPEIKAAVLEADAYIDEFMKSVSKWFDETHQPNDELYFLLTTDHGMASIHTVVNLDRLLGADLTQDARIITSGPIASIYLDNLPATPRFDRAAQIVAKLKTNPFLSAWQARDIPQRLHYSDPSRIGDVVVLLAPGYSFTSLKTAATLPAGLSPRAMHGYDPAVCPDMFGTAIVWWYRHSLGGRDLGPVDNTQWHASVAKLLGIAPAPASDQRVIELP